MKRARHNESDPMERQIERAFCPGEFIHDRACFSFVSGLEQVAKGVKELITTEPARAAALCETFLAGCHAKAEQLDDSSGNFGMFVKDLICLWIKARQADGANPDKTATRLLAWMDDDPYAFCYEIEKDTAAAFDQAGRAAFEKQIRARLEAVSGDPASWGIQATEYSFARDLFGTTECFSLHRARGANRAYAGGLRGHRQTAGAAEADGCPGVGGA